MRIAVIDGQGGGIGTAVVEKLKKGVPEVEVIALGTNAIATDKMIKAGADDGATGENAVIHNMEHVDVVIGVVGILVANSMMGEMTPAMATAIGGSHTHKILLPLNRCHINVVGLDDKSMGKRIDAAVLEVKQMMEDGK